ncbi:MAG TPA: VOC family protein [Candidatus Coatesbacteria bacterium]|nr:VOC family protein [Candidatus Coatesbacteria bacterium]
MAKHDLFHFEWATTDIAKTQKFFKGLFGWKFIPWADDYVLFRTPSGLSGALALVDEPDPTVRPLLYFEVAELGPYMKKVKKLGGEVISDIQEAPGLGEFAIFADPDGSFFGVFKPLKEDE